MNRSLLSRKSFGALIDAVVHILYGAARIFAWDSLKSGFIDIRRLARVPRVLALAGLALVFGFVVSILFNDPLRTSGVLELLPISSNATRAIFVPSTAVPLTLIALVLAWSLILTSALHIQRWARWGIFLSYLFFGVPSSFIATLSGAAVESPLLLFLILLLAALCWLGLLAAFVFLPRRKFSITLEFGIVLSSVGGLFVLMLFSAVQATQLGSVDFVNGYLTADAITNPRNLIIPLICLSGAEIIDFGITFTGWGAQATARYARAWMVTLLLGAFLLFRWGNVFLANFLPGVSNAQMLAWGGAALAGAALLPIAWWRLRQKSDDSISARLRIGLVLLLVAPPMLNFLVILVLEIFLLAFTVLRFVLTGTLDSSALSSLNNVSDIVVGLATLWRESLYVVLTAVGIGMAMYGARRARFTLAAFGMILAWTQFVYWLMQNGRPLQHLRYRFGDLEIWILLALTALTIYWLARRQLTKDRALKLLALAVFAWLLNFTDFLDNPLTLFFGLAGISYTAFGIFWAVLTAGGRWRVNGDSPQFPNSSRVLLSIGYVLLTLNISHWFLVTHNIAERALNDDITLLGLRVIGYTLAYLVIVEGGRALLKGEK